MKKTALIVTLAVVMLAMFSAGCYRTQQPYPEDNPGVVPTVPPAAGLFATVAISNSSGGGTAVVVVALTQGSTGPGITGATVTINGTPIPDTGGGSYGGTVTGLVAGNTVTLSITSSAGNGSCSAPLPATGGGTSSTAISGADSGSMMTLLNI
jgi:hypothetical protein